MPEPASSAPEVTFEVERFEWISGERLEVAGRWYGIRGRRFLRPTLDVEVEGDRHRMLALLDHKPWAADDGEEWLAAFAWKGDAVEVVDAELSVSPDLAVPLPLPATTRRTAKRKVTRSSPVRERRTARRPRAESLESELAAARADATRARNELDAAREAHEAAVERERRRFTAEQQTAAQLAAELKEAREQAAAARAEAAEAAEELRRERDGALADAAAARADSAKLRLERDGALARQAGVERELEAAERARDEARAERNAWLSRARTAVLQRDTAVAERDAALGERHAAEAKAAPATPRASEAGRERAAKTAITKRKPPEPKPTSGSEPGAAEPAEGAPGTRIGLIEVRNPLFEVDPDAGRSFVAVWGPRLAALVALVALVAIVVVLVAWAA